MELYHVAKERHLLGASIRPYSIYANGKVVIDLLSSLYQLGEDHFISQIISNRLHNALFRHPYFQTSLINEVIFEEVRKKSFPNRRSRMHSSFFCSDLSDALRFKDQYRKDGILYKCKLIDGEIFTSDMDLVNPSMTFDGSNPLKTLQMVKDNATRYWEGVSSPKIPETLVFGKVIVAEEVPPTLK